jgi:hypothetical protein
MIQINLNKPIDYIIMHALSMVTNATSYDVMIAGLVLCPMGVTIDFWEKTTYYCPSW